MFEQIPEHPLIERVLRTGYPWHEDNYEPYFEDVEEDQEDELL